MPRCEKTRAVISKPILDELLGILARKFSRDAEELARVAVFLSDLARANSTLEMPLKTGVNSDIEVTYVNLDKRGRTALMETVECCYDNWRFAIPLLLRYGADVNATDSQGNTPPTLAAKAKRKDIAEVLLSAGAR